MAAPFDANAVTIYSTFAQFELLTSGSSMPEASQSCLRLFAKSDGKLYYMPDGASGSAAKEIATSAGGLDYDLTQGAGIASFTYNGSAAATVAVDINSTTATTTAADVDEMLIDDGAGGTIRKITRANFLGSALASLDAGIDVNGSNFTVSTAGAVVAASLNNSSGGITNAGSIAGATTIAASSTVTAEGVVSGAAGTFDALAGTSLALQSGGITAAGAIAGATTIAASSTVTAEGVVSGAAGTFDALAGTSLALQSGGITAAGAIAGATSISGSGTISGFDLDMEGAGNFLGNLTVQGNLIVEGSKTVLDTTNLQIEDNLIELNRGDGSSGTAQTNAAAGLYISGSTGDRAITLTGASDGGRLKVSGSSTVGAGYDVVSGGDYAIAGTSVLNATTLGSAVVASSLTSVGTLSAVTVSGLSSFEGNVDLGNATSDTITATGRFDSDLVPSSDSARDLGTSALQWAELHVDTGNIDQLGSALDANANNITNVGTFEVDGAATFNANVTLGNASTDVVTSTAQITASAGMLVADDIKLEFGSDKDASIAYDEANSNALVISGSAQGILMAGVTVPLYDDTYDLGSSSNQWKDLYIDGVAYIDSLQADQLGAALDCNSQAMTNVDINSGNIDGTVIGAASVAAGSFAAVIGTTADFSSTLNADGNATFNGNVTLGNATADDLTFTGRVASDVVPKTDSAYDLGTSALQFATAYVDEVESATGVLTLTTAAGIAVAGTANAAGYLLELPTTGDARARAWVTYSSARHKTNVHTLENPVETLKQLRGVSYDWKGTGQNDVGFIAEEVGAIVPEVVSFGKDGRAEGIDYGRLTSVLVEAMKQQQGEIEKLQSVVKNLTSEQPSLLEDK